MAGHTPGPWSVNDPSLAVRAGGGAASIIAWMADGPNGRPSYDERAANARLIAAAPKLLGAMQGRDIDPDVTPIEWISSLVTDVRAALDSEQWEYEDVASLRECLWNIDTFLTAARAAVAEAVGEV